MDQQTHVEYPEKLVYAPFSYQGVRFALGVTGTVYASAKGVPVRSVGLMTFQDSGKPWIPKHRNFNSICRQMYRDGDVDEIVAEHKRLVARRKALRNAAPELLEALEAMNEAFRVDQTRFTAAQADAVRKMDAAIARATGGEA